MAGLLGKWIKRYWGKGNIITFELDDWYKWYKEPEKFHRAAVKHLRDEGHIVETISVVRTVYSNKVSVLVVDGIKYELSAITDRQTGITQLAQIRRIDV